VALAGCGGDGDDESDGGQGGKEARNVVLRYFKEVEADRSEKACSTYLTKDGVLNIYGQDTCKGVIDLVPGPVRVDSVEQEDDTARVVVFLSPGNKDQRVVSLREEGGSLKIDAIEMPGE
jgi:hypothetical protein